MGLELRPSYAIWRFTKSGDREQGTRNREQGTGSTRKGASGGKQWSPLFVVREELRRNPRPCRHVPAGEIGREHVRTPVTNAHLVCHLLLEKQKKEHK